MKRYSEYMDSVEVPEELHEKLTRLATPARRPAWRKYGAVAAALVLAVGAGAFAVNRLGGADPHNWEELEAAYSPAIDIAPAAPGEDPAGAEDGMKTIGGYEVASGDGAQGVVSYYMLPYIAYGDASGGTQADYSLVPPDGGLREATIDDILAVFGLDEDGLSTHLGWGGYELSGQAGFNADGTPCMMNIYGTSDNGFFSLEMRAGELPPQCCIIFGEERTVTQVWGVEVSGVKNMGAYGDPDRGVYLDVTREVEFIAHGVGVRFKAYGDDDGAVEQFTSRFVRWAVVEGLDLTRLSAGGAQPVGAGSIVREPNYEDGAGTPSVLPADRLESVPAEHLPSVDQEDEPAVAVTGIPES